MAKAGQTHQYKVYVGIPMADVSTGDWEHRILEGAEPPAVQSISGPICCYRRLKLVYSCGDLGGNRAK